jgi:hypothetical protein
MPLIEFHKVKNDMTNRMGIAGYVSVCVQLYCVGSVFHHMFWAYVAISSETESFKHMKIKYPTHLKMAM